MAVHMIRLVSSVPPGNVKTAIGNWITNHNEWTDDPVSHDISTANTELDGSGTDYLRGDFRFTLDEGKTNLLDDLRTQLEAITDWYRVGYHVCEHDEANGSSCSWDDQEEHNPSQIPSGVPNFL